jgi:hypothetical protein
VCSVGVRAKPEETNSVRYAPQVECERVASAAGADDQILIVKGKNRVVDSVMAGVKRTNQAAIGAVQKIGRIAVFTT